MPTDTAPRIRPLPAPAAARLRSSLAVTSLADAVSELVQNSLDAGARTVAVQANVARNSCVVEDDGAGILPADVAMVGVMHATSKYNNPAPAPATRTFGSRGLALSSLSAHSLFTLTTRHASSAATHTTRISYSTPLTAAGPSPPHLRLPRPGTTVRIDALHADLPVRFHARLAAATANPDAEWSTITRRAAHLLLLAPSAVSFTARDEHGARRIAVRAPPATTTATATTGRTGSWRMAVLRQVYGRAAVGADWERVRAGTATTTIRGHISAAKGHGTRELQFLAVNGHPLVGAASALHAEANRVFAASSFGCEDGEGRRKGVERWPMFVLEVECAAGAEVLGGEGGTEGKGGLEGAWLAGAVELLGRLVAEFLRAHGFSAAAEGVKRPIEGGVRGRGGGGGRAGTPLRTITNGSAAVNHGDTRALALWSRVKAAKRDAREEEGRKGGGFSAGMATARRSSTTDTDTDTDTDTRGIATSSSSPDDSSKENEDGSGSGSAGAGDSHSLWRDPRSKHVFRVNARTGNNSPATTTARKRALSLSSSAASRTAKKPRTEEEEKEKEARGPFVDALLKNWTNPVFPRTEAPIPSTTQHTHHHCGPSSSSSSPFTTTTTQPRAALGKLTKPGLATATVLAQLDRKYILLKMRGLSPTTTTTSSSSSSSPSTPTLLVLLDQHAASERIRTEALLSSLATAAPQRLAPPLHYALADDADAALMRRYEGVFRAWGVHCAVVVAPAQGKGQGQGKGKGQILAITALPAAVADRCVGEPALALAMVRRHVYALVEGGKKCAHTGGEGDGRGGGDWVKGLAGCPVGLVEMVNSRACRGAVMFGDALGMEECVSLVRALAGCRFPFMCAHGRPSMVPLVDLGVGAVEEGGRRRRSGGFKKDFGEWMERRKDGGE